MKFTRSLFYTPPIKFKLTLLVISLGLMTNTEVYALPTSDSILPLMPRATVWGVTGDNSFGEGDAMLPVWGNPDQTIYIDGNAKYGRNNAWFGSVGLGGRKIIQDSTLLGAYFFTDVNRTPYSNYFTVLNPGVEFMTNHWDGHLNTYFPVNEKTKLIGIFSGKQLNYTNTTFFSGHSEFDQLYNYVENVGSGTDIEVGHTFTALRRTRIFAGGYHFAPKHTSNINGIAAGIEVPLHFKGAALELRDSYDNVRHNTFLLSLRLTLGGPEKTTASSVQERMLDPIPRHLANWSNGNGIPSRTKVINNGRRTLVKDNIWFFNPNNSNLVLTPVVNAQNCTYEHPCFGLGQSQIDAVNRLSANANFYLNSGNYLNPSVGSAYTFRNGQNVFGRTNNFSQQALGNLRPLLNDSLLLEGNNNIYNVRVNGNSAFVIPDSGQTVAFQVGAVVLHSATGSVNIFNSDITSAAFPGNVLGVGNLSLSAPLTLNNSTVSATNTWDNTITVGVVNLHSATLNILNSNVTATASYNTPRQENLLFGAVNNESGVLNITNSSINVNGINAGLAAAILNNSTIGTSITNINQSSISAVGSGSQQVHGIFNQGNNLSKVSGNVNINQSNIAVLSNSNNGGQAYGVATTGSFGVVSINNSTVNAKGDSGYIRGLGVLDSAATMSVQNTTVAVNTTNSASGSPVFNNGGTFNDNGGNQCTLNGVAVPCA
ncbi:hypothetical protein BH10PSE19_BH10PSE19_06730 [soil metagenome]